MAVSFPGPPLCRQTPTRHCNRAACAQVSQPSLLLRQTLLYTLFDSRCCVPRTRHDGLALASAWSEPLVGAEEEAQQTSTLTPEPSTSGNRANGATPGSTANRTPPQKRQRATNTVEGPLRTVTKPLPRVLLVHTGGTLGMDPQASYAHDSTGHLTLKPGTGGRYQGGLRPGSMLNKLLAVVPELSAFANLELKVAFNKDSSRVGHKDWVVLARLLHTHRDAYDAFLIVHGTDTLAYTASALSLMLGRGFGKPIVLTGSQLPIVMPRSDARQNLIDSITCATASFRPPHVHLQEVAICFGGHLMRGNRAQKVNASSYQAFESPSYPRLATLGVDVEWSKYLLTAEGTYRPRFRLDAAVMRVPIVPGTDPRLTYGDLAGRGVKGIVLEAFGVGNMPDGRTDGWLPWLRLQRRKGLQVALSSQCVRGALHPELYRSGSVALKLGCEGGPQMTPECAVVKMMLCLSYPDLPFGVPMAGEM